MTLRQNRGSSASFSGQCRGPPALVLPSMTEVEHGVPPRQYGWARAASKKRGGKWGKNGFEKVQNLVREASLLAVGTGEIMEAINGAIEELIREGIRSEIDEFTLSRIDLAWCIFLWREGW
jgi:hypothetical protein